MVNCVRSRRQKRLEETLELRIGASQIFHRLQHRNVRREQLRQLTRQALRHLQRQRGRPLL